MPIHVPLKQHANRLELFSNLKSRANDMGRGYFIESDAIVRELLVDAREISRQAPMDG